MKIEICMGSSCFARGNNDILNRITTFVDEHGLSATVEMRGHLCVERCAAGPSIRIDGAQYDGLTPEAVHDVLQYHLRMQPI
jgi:NADH:ubiquinone oxidoreductase subunit E